MFSLRRKIWKKKHKSLTNTIRFTNVHLLHVHGAGSSDSIGRSWVCYSFAYVTLAARRWRATYDVGLTIHLVEQRYDYTKYHTC